MRHIECNPWGHRGLHEVAARAFARKLRNCKVRVERISLQRKALELLAGGDACIEELLQSWICLAHGLEARRVAEIALLRARQAEGLNISRVLGKCLRGF